MCFERHERHSPFAGDCGVFLLGGGAILEIWKDIPGYEGLYQVSNTGKVRSLNWRKQGVIKELTLKETPQGQLQAEFSKDGKRKTFLVQSLVEAAFPPEVPQKEELPEEPKQPVGRSILQLTLYGEPVKQWDDAEQIRKALGFHTGSILECCHSPKMSAYGFKWQFAE